ncbi:MAG TPA: rhodanese-like domain-containing protein [Methanothrix sp.]|nr:rhodanese-like domain-containing protein [Methanothrix sp.]
MKHLRSYPRSFSWGAVGIALLALLVLANGAYAGEAYCEACQGGGGWDPMAKLDEIGNPDAGEAETVMAGLNTAQKNRVGIWNKPLSGFEGSNTSADKSANTSAPGTVKASQSPLVEKASTKTAEENQVIVRSERAKSMIAPLEEAASGTIYLDISENSTEHIPGSIVIPYTQFLNDTAVLSADELAALLGEAGISREDAVIVYGECMPCGGGPAPATFIYWILRSLGHDNVKVLDGMVEDWAAAGLPTSTDAGILPAKAFVPRVSSNFSAEYSYVESGQAQIVDARSIGEFATSSIPGAINIPYESVISGNRLRDESRLERIFGILDREQPVVVFTNTGLKASVVWYALELLGYDARLYSYENYWINQQTLNQESSLNSSE